jgi:16S rRNA (cytosine1407-C5)-methyltransferase
LANGNKRIWKRIIVYYQEIMAKKKKQKQKTITNKIDALALAMQRMQELLPADAYADLQAELNQPLRPAIRLNPLKVETQHTIAEWQHHFGWKVENIPYCMNGYWIEEAQTPLSKPLEYHFGQYYIQDAASMLPVELFDFQSEHPLVLDMAASPGGKTTHILSRIMDKGFVLANDASKSRLTALQLVLQNWGALNVGVTSFNGESFGQWYANTFDAVLLDAPCSMQNLRNTESHPMRAITDSERQSLSGRQQRLLLSALQAVKEGGEVVYATCTLSPEEDEFVLDAVKKVLGNQIEIVDMNSRLSRPAPAFSSLGDFTFENEVQNGLRIWPHLFRTSGFFSAKIRKNSTFGADTPSRAPYRDMRDLGWMPLSRIDQSWLESYLLDEYGFDLQAWMDVEDTTLIRYKDKVFAFPHTYFDAFDGLPVQMLGMLLGEFTGEGFQPEHDFLTRFHALFSSGQIQLDNTQEQAWLRGEDMHGLNIHDQTNGKYLITINQAGDYIGLGKVTQNRFRNMLPRRALL